MNFRYAFILTALLTLPIVAMDKGKQPAKSTWGMGSLLTSVSSMLVSAAQQQATASHLTPIEQLQEFLTGTITRLSNTGIIKVVGFTGVKAQQQANGTIRITNLLGFSLNLNVRQLSATLSRDVDGAILFTSTSLATLNQEAIVDGIARVLAPLIVQNGAQGQPAARQRALLANVELALSEGLTSVIGVAEQIATNQPVI